ncbi:CheR family methyltransferase [Pseudoduganella namucuonensis]|uniref:Two-component system, chemotaxis family, CheB/CheR fusion protein n=1 Tax=Pseudoduganella namucuonensis TaxID=1035707 RepID=A0A1I7JUH9_9BURK|nr:CheR family methyltransferase [Pseudoduganella namucuonensis]SFU88799.1 two-component system, chemotaxis family, CheB/CheR fusion protein [Pseudoduganella namucuonensis]
MNSQQRDTSQPAVMPGSQTFPVVGIGASAGGLQALMAFFEQLPAEPGMAFVVVMHLSPTHESNAQAILQRSSKMPVREVTRALPVEVNTVYVISPALQLEMNDGYLGVRERPRESGRPVAIDRFLRTMALAHKERAFGVILSGTGSDGADGLAMVKDQGGVILVQDPEEAEHAGMPKAAIDTGLSDFVLPVRAIPAKLLGLWANARQIRLHDVGGDELAEPAEPDQRAAAEEALRDIVNLLRVRTGHDFSKYKRATVLRRIERRLQVRELKELSAYRDLLRDDRGEAHALLKDMLIGVTQFFRDREVFEAVERDVIPQLFRNRAEGDQIRVWSVACSTGEEAYTLAMLLAERAAALENPADFQVFGSDIDERAIAVARAGVYSASIADDVSAPRLSEHFARDEGRYRINKAVRDKILFANQNLLRDPPFSRLDMISCRNLLIYLNRDTHAQVLEMFHFALKSDGFLLLGSSESADTVADYFIPVDKKHRIYRAKPAPHFARAAIPMAMAPVAAIPVAPPAQQDKGKRSYAGVHQRVLAEYAPPSVLVDQHANIVHLSEGTGQFLRHVAGEPSRHLVDLVEPELRLELRTALYHATQSGKSVETRRLRLERGQRVFFVNMTARPFFDAGIGADFVLVLFHKAEQTTEEQAPDSRGVGQEAMLSGLEEELQRTRAQLQETVEHSETSNEELKASNEELQAINEELRSATEELETSKEELQSVNEELTTVNYELKSKVEETGKVNDDLQNLIASTDLATIFVDRGMRIKRYTPQASKLFNLIPGDVGRPLHDITHKLDYPELARDATTAFESLQSVEREVASGEGRWYIARLLPYRTAHDRIDGAVLTFIDITGRRQAEDKVRASEERMRLVADSTRDYAIITMDRDGLITSFNSGAERLFGHTEEEILGQPDSVIFTPEDRSAGIPEQEKRRAREDGRAEDERWHLRKDGSRFYCSGVMTPLRDGEFYGYAKIGRDLTGRLEQEKHQGERLRQAQHSSAEARSASAQKDEFLAIMSHELKHPLNLIHMNAELLLRSAAVGAAPLIGKAVQAIRAAAVSQAKIINDLLDMSRINTGKLTLSLHNLDLCELVKGIAGIATEDPNAAGLRIVCEDDSGPLFVYADRVRMEQVVSNLLSNAIKFTPQEGEIALRLGAQDGWVRLQVRDSGQGIAAEYLPTIFEMFGQGTPSIMRGARGLGIGLALVRQIVELHGGRIEAESAGPGQGACFTVWLPRAEQRRHELATVAAAPAPALTGVKVLLVDDSPEGLETFHMLLEIVGAEVRSTTSALEALDLLVAERYDLIVSDLAMPGMDGYSFIREVRKRNGYGDVPAIAITGLGRAGDVERALEAGFSGHLGKPIDVDTLVAYARRLLDSREGQPDAR